MTSSLDSQVSTLQRNLNSAEGSINTLFQKQELLETVLGDILLNKGIRGEIQRKGPSKCAKITAALLGFVAIAAIAVLIACVTAACGLFPLFVTALNLITLGACVSLPIVGCVSVALLLLATLAIDNLLGQKQPIFVIAPPHRDRVTP